MKFLRKASITILALLPLGPISASAQAKLLDLQESPEETEIDWRKLMNAKSKLFPSYGTSVHVEQAREIFRTRTQISDPILFEREFQKTIDYLDSKGMLKKDGLIMRSGAPSEGGIVSP